MQTTSSETTTRDPMPNRMRQATTNLVVRSALRLMALSFNLRPKLRDELRGADGWLDLTAGIRTEDRTIEGAICFEGGKVRTLHRIPSQADAVLVFENERVLRELLKATPSDQIAMVLEGKLQIEGSYAMAQLFLYLQSLLLIEQQKKMMTEEQSSRREEGMAQAPAAFAGKRDALEKRRGIRMRAPSVDAGVEFLQEPFLSKYQLDDFPRIKAYRDRHFIAKAEVCTELPKLLTDWHKANGFETQGDGTPWIPELRRGHVLNYVLENRMPIIRENDLIAGTSTRKDVGVLVYPDGHATTVWSELLTAPHRTINPYGISDDARNVLHREVFPYWVHRNFREWVRDKYDEPLCQRIDQRFAVYFLWKQSAISHTIPDLPKILRLGTRGMIAEVRERLSDPDLTERQRATLEAMVLCLQGLTTYSKHLSCEASLQAEATDDARRRAELEKLAQICHHVVEKPARTLHEAVNAIWIAWVGLHMENSNAGLSLGRLDQWLQPYFAADMARLRSDTQRQAYEKHALELTCCLLLRCTDHLPLSPELGNYLFGGSSSDQAVTLGGVTADGQDAVCDMTYVFLKATEMLGLREPNVNARYHPEKNSDTYLLRLCEVNRITSATPSIHNDAAVMKSLEQYGYDECDLRDWSATGCVEPTLSGKHMGHTNFEMMNMVGALEMALCDGWHPVLRWKLGPSTGAVDNGDFKTFDQFFDAFAAQLEFLIAQSIEYNEMLGEAHQQIRPTPLLSSLVEGCVQSGRDVTHGGAKYNSSGAACIGLADVTDSLLVIKKLVFDDEAVSFSELKRAVDCNFEGHEALLARIKNRVPLFGSGSAEAVAMANRVTEFVHRCFSRHDHYRGGHYTAGFWSMSNHVAYGTLSGALPSGKLRGKAFTPGLTPQPIASKSLLRNLEDVAKLRPEHMPNNIAFNVKVVPAADEKHESMVNTMSAYAKAYFELGGMQMQMNVIGSDTLRDAMAHPEDYRDLLVRISGYNAYFVTLNRDMQIELIERAEYGI